MNRILYRLQNALFRLFNPYFWLQNEMGNMDLDIWLINKMKENADVRFVHKYVVEIDGKQVWNANYPYCYGSIWRPEGIEGLPLALTRYRLRKYINRALMQKSAD